ncbi:MAG TPA: proteasome accessory factor PafA2 family protein [Fimbriimonadaceae bacterium]|nr:proteasome accessory factor PafA2 family protein [Fimbriimonadaceae bacterium]
MSGKILAGIETEYGLYLEGRGAEDQIDDSMALVRKYPGECFVHWDYRYESPRADLRGFRLERLAFDPADAKFDEGKVRGKDHEVRSDRILPNGARFYNDHGHPEYSTPECWSLDELALHDCAGQIVVRRAAEAYAEASGHRVHVYKNNTDFHGASYGTHENYLVPRSLGFESLYRAVLPMLVARQILTGAGKVGSEAGAKCPYQLSQRADFFAEPVNTETLYRRPIFNTRDEPHADPRDWIRLHVISGDANMIPRCTARKAGLVKLALLLAVNGTAPVWRIADPVRAFQSISRDQTGEYRIELEGRSWTTAREILESYFSAGESTLELDDDSQWVIHNSRLVLEALNSDPAFARAQVDWVAKRGMLEHFMEEEGLDWDDPSLPSFDLEYHNVDPEQSLYGALQEMGTVEGDPPERELIPRISEVFEPTRAAARGVAVANFGDYLKAASWSSLTFEIEGKYVELELRPDVEYPQQLREIRDVGTFIETIKERMA